MTFFVIVAWIMLFFGTCWVLLAPALIVGVISVGVLSLGNPKKHELGALIGGVGTFAAYCYAVWWYLHHIDITFLVG